MKFGHNNVTISPRELTSSRRVSFRGRQALVSRRDVFAGEWRTVILTLGDGGQHQASASMGGAGIQGRRAVPHRSQSLLRGRRQLRRHAAEF